MPAFLDPKYPLRIGKRVPRSSRAVDEISSSSSRQYSLRRTPARRQASVEEPDITDDTAEALDDGPAPRIPESATETGTPARRSVAARKTPAPSRMETPTPAGLDSPATRTRRRTAAATGGTTPSRTGKKALTVDSPRTIPAARRRAAAPKDRSRSTSEDTDVVESRQLRRKG